jgi:hypothetical protein
MSPREVTDRALAKVSTGTEVSAEVGT